MSKIMVVDDSPTEVELLGWQLRAAGYEVVTHSEAMGTLVRIIRENPDLVVLDVTMPMLEGPTLCRLLKSEVKSRIPVVLHSSLEEAELIRRVQECGAQGYLSKTWSKEAKLDAIRALLG